MTQEATERRGIVPRSTLIIDSAGLALGRELASLVDALRLGPKVDVTQSEPNPENPNIDRLSVSGTLAQLDVFRSALDVYQHAVAENLPERVVQTRMNDFYTLRATRAS